MPPVRAALLAMAAAAGAAAPAAPAGSLPAARGGVRPGPSILHAPAASAPQLENTGIWRAPPILVSGTTAYRDGEFLYQDFLYDDLGAGDAARYPDDPRYAGNAADLVELRLRPVQGALAVRLTYNSMVEPALAATTVALGETPVVVALPHGAPARMPAELFVTVHGGEADAVDGRSGAVVAASLPVALDPARRQVEVRVPASVLDLAGRRALRVAAVSGTWDPAQGRFAALFNVALRTQEPPSAWRTQQQARALTDGDLSAFSATVDLAKLAAGEDDDSGVPRSGFMDRILVSASEPRQGRGDAASRKPGCEAPCVLQYAGRLQPYALYVPAGPAPRRGWPLTLDLHGCNQTYNIGLGTRRQRQLGERAGGSVVLTPEARGDCYWYFGPAAADVFEAWADVARRHPLDPRRTSVLGSSMGGYGALKLAAAYPDLFARAAGIVPCPGAGIEWSGARSVPGGISRSLAPLLPSLRHVPVMGWLTTGDATCRYDSQAALLGRLHGLGYAYSALTFQGVDHTTLATAALGDAGPVADFLGAARTVSDPARVTYVFNPTVSEPEHGLQTDHAYWVSGVLPYSFRRPGRIDVVSEGLGRAGGRRRAPEPGTGRLSGGLEYARLDRVVDEPGRGDGPHVLRIAGHGIREITVDPRRARTGCAPRVETSSYELVQIRMAGCRRTYAVKRVCHATPVFDVVVRAPGDERARRRSVTLDGRPVRLRGRKARLDVRRRPDALARVEVVSVDRSGRTHVRQATHRWCPG